MAAVKTIGLEEHFVTTDVLHAWRELDRPAMAPLGEDEMARRLAELGDMRLSAMADTGLDVAVLSLTTPGVQNLPAGESVALQTTCNDLVAETVRAHPEKLQGFATLATPDPTEAARELERAVTALGLNLNPPMRRVTKNLII